MLKKYRILMVLIIFAVLSIFLNPGTHALPVEALSIPSGISLDLKTDERGVSHYAVGLNNYTFNKKDEVNHFIVSGAGRNIPDTRETRQLKSNHRLVFGLIKVINISENFARKGLQPSLDTLFANEFTHDMGWMVVCKGTALDLLKLKVSDFPTSSDFIEGLIESSMNQNFFSDNYKIIDAYVRVDAEGRSLILPYLEIKNKLIEITGTALFKKDKMMRKINIKETKVMNFLRENNVQGILTLDNGSNRITSLYGKVKRKVRCNKLSDNKYIFYIDLDYTGNVISNTIYDDFLEEPTVINKFEDTLALETEKMCYEFIKKMQSQYKVDCLELGRVAAAKYGRRTGVDWDKVVSNSEIKVSVKINVDRFGRGQYTMD